MESLGDILKRLRLSSTSNAGVAPDWLEGLEAQGEPEACPLCAGRGWVRRDAPVGHPDFGRAFPCACQGLASSEARLVRLMRFSNLGMLADIQLNDINPQGPGTGAEARARYEIAYDAARQFADKPAGMLLLSGGNGVGKTHLAAAAANRLIERGQPVFFAFVPDLLDRLRASYAPESELGYEELFELVKNAPALVLDDLGAHSGVAWAEEKLFQIVNHRYVANLPTIVTSSVRIDRLDGRLQTRLTDSRWSRVIDLGGSVKTGSTAMGTIPAAMREAMTFDSFDPRGRGGDDQTRQMLAHALTATRSFADSPDSWLVLLGGPGSGKTHLAVAVANRQLDQGRDVFYSFVPDLLDHLRYAYSPDSRITYDELFDRVKQTRLLILDDLGGEKSSPWANEKLYQIIVHRHHAKLPTIVTSRRLPNEEGDPIASRLMDSRVVAMVPMRAPDYRATGSLQRRDSPPARRFP